MRTVQAFNTQPARVMSRPSTGRRRPWREALEPIVVRLVEVVLYALAACIAVACVSLGGLLIVLGLLTLPFGIGAIALMGGLWVIGLAATACAGALTVANGLGGRR